MAGLWKVWTDPASKQRIVSFAILTTSANEALASIHERMPVILADEDLAAWIASETPPDALQAFLKPAPDDALIAYEISTRVNRVANDDASILEPATASPCQMPLL